jgi:hypothetical protein
LIEAKKMDDKFKFPYDPEQHGPIHSIPACDHLAARFVAENREDYAAWLQAKGIDPADAFAWAGRMENLHQVAARLALGLGDRCVHDGSVL